MTDVELLNLAIIVRQLATLFDRGGVEVLGIFVDAGAISSEDAYKVMRHVVAECPQQGNKQ